MNAAADPNDPDIMRKLVANAADQLREHFDSVHIFCTTYLTDGSTATRAIDVGRGNYYARAGQVREWLVREDQRERIATDRSERENEL